ncbi:tellurium resistance protein terB [Desulfonema ishimotonii]|uniref:Tellurium resistance protein terB n=1 Tax=Desulfonema ishimotonii TaxID=45657 RepID=A0A401FUQ6_9BACT|nr:TerB family tellurite resistance protein [Desulfonema ishimotonii]GBC60702.1 tellurium resistance protein terB [Desulfonema ishimotonii]
MIGLLKRRSEKARKRGFLEAIAAACAMVAAADGIVRPEEMAKLLEFIRIDDTLKEFDSTEVIGAFERYIETLDFDFRIGKEKAFKAIRAVERRSGEARILILVCRAIGEADDDFDNSQRYVVRQICETLGFSPGQFDLDLRSPSVRDFPKAFEKKKKEQKMPEWMRDSATLPSPPVKKKKRDGDMPKWMRHPPEPPRKPDHTDSELPEWMRIASTPDAPANKKNRKEEPPEWMRQSAKSSPKPEREELPEWMKKIGDHSGKK